MQGRYLATLTSPPSAGYIAAVVAVNLFGYFIFRSSNLQKVQSPVRPCEARGLRRRTCLHVCSDRFRSDDGLQHRATGCSTVPRAATPCHVLEHRVTSCNTVGRVAATRGFVRICSDATRADLRSHISARSRRSVAHAYSSARSRHRLSGLGFLGGLAPAAFAPSVYGEQARCRDLRFKRPALALALALALARHWPGTGPACRAVAQCSSASQSAASTGEDESPAEPLSPHFRMVGCGAQDQLHRRLADGPVVVPVCRQRQLDPLLLQVPTVPLGARDGCAMPFRPTHSMHASFVCAGRSAQSLVGAAFTFSSCSAIVRGATTSAAKTSTATTGRSTRRQSRPSLSLAFSDGRCCLPSLPVRVPHRCSVHRRQMRPINGQRATRASRAIGR